MLRDKLVDELSATPQQFLLHLHAQASKLTWQACTEICITQSWTVRPTMRKDLFFTTVTEWSTSRCPSEKIVSAAQLCCVSIWPSRCPSEFRGNLLHEKYSNEHCYLKTLLRKFHVQPRWTRTLVHWFLPVGFSTWPFWFTEWIALQCLLQFGKNKV